ncbi:GNAT family N-acetyltransferase [Marmoricola sp. Leaf446]|uniref:GNAT family N-acetyltransferase n=1 Tax=Marmoricola sp. Leaf446 TaxID=1736379 RepID=UPI000AB908F2|nr:GNAT family N-acetyltransferase [Marmoricola sp. Leaf446]
MSITSEPWPHPDPTRSRLRLVQVPAPLLHALARGAAGAADPVVGGYVADPGLRPLWGLRSRQVTARPDDAAWVTRLVVVPGVAVPVGVAGFHGPPDDAGMVEVGYRTDPAHRRRGHARHALQTLLAVAAAHPDVRVVRATVSPDNHVSRALVEAHGFVETGEQWDEEDGLEIVLERPAAVLDTPEPPG